MVCLASCSNDSSGQEEWRSLRSSALTALAAVEAWQNQQAPAEYVERTLDAMRESVARKKPAPVATDIAAAILEARKAIAEGDGKGARSASEKLSRDLSVAQQAKPTQ